ncbi:MAG TPA: hypothetical protein DCY20_05335, partial [Firmicutes bacterium]|nr:hypothetical protein [Bacillota bacterium]
AILAAIAVPAFGSIREKANVSADTGNARTIYSLIATELASDNLTYQNDTTTKISGLVLKNTSDKSIASLIEPTPNVKTYQNYEFAAKIDDGNIQIYVVDSSGKNAKAVYPAVTDKYSR